MSVVKDRSWNGAFNWLWAMGTAVTASLSLLVSLSLLSKRRLHRKLQRKREQCRKTLEQVKQELSEHRVPASEKEAIVRLTLSALQAKLQSGELKALDVLRAYQHKALEVHAKTNCVVEAIAEAKEVALSCDRHEGSKPVLHGVPLSLKENLALKGYDTTAGLQANIGVPCTEEAVVVQVFKRHGAVPFVRTNLPQAMLSYACTNPIFGMARNPHNLDHCPGGSSGGEGALLGGGGSIIGLGTDVGGSIRVPAAFCGVYALKPTQGRISKLGSYTVNKGRVLISGVVSPIARDVDSLVTMMRVLASPDMFELDPSLPPIPFQDQLLTSTHQLRVGFYSWDGNMPPVPAITRAVHQARDTLQALGHTVVEFTPPDYANMYGGLFVSAMVGADKAKTLFRALKGDHVDNFAIKSLFLARLPGWIISLLARIMQKMEPVVSRSVKNSIADGSAFSWFKKSEEILRYRQRFTEEWRKQRLDVVICPAFQCPAPKNEHVGFLTIAGTSCALYNVVNFPAGVVPVTKVSRQDVADVNNTSIFPARTRLEKYTKMSCDTEDTVGLPVCVQCVTLPFKEELCLRVMRELETALNYQDDASCDVSLSHTHIERETRT